MMKPSGSGRSSMRLKESQNQRIMDESTREKRIRKRLEILEADNYQQDPNPNLVVSKEVPKFDDNLEPPKKSKEKVRTAEYYQRKYGKSFQQMVEDDSKEAEANNRVSYNDMAAPKSKLPPIYLCDVCGYESKYTCVTCGTKICQKKCFDVHYETRCLK